MENNSNNVDNTIDLNSIHSPRDIKGMDISRLTQLAAEIRAVLIRKLSVHGGHVGPNLGMVEAIIALHYVFDAPADSIVFDVSHQSYVHKMLTGRMKAFTDPELYDDVTGYTNPAESPEYDLFSVGHTSTSLSLATGLAKARDLKGGHGNVVAVIGDGSLGGGQALEGLNYGATLGSNLIVVVNDNDMSIAHNHGGLYGDLKMLRDTNGTGEPNIFRAFGYRYLYVGYGNHLPSLIEAFRSVRDSDTPVVVHINTQKGMGLPAAEADRETFHWTMPFDAATGAPLDGTARMTYNDLFAETMLRQMRANPSLAVLTAGTPGAIGFTPARRHEAGRQFIDVGIAEQDAVGMAAGMAKAGIRPMFGVAGTFLQRAYDQLSQDVAINRLPAAFTVFHTGVYGINDETHLGFFDIPLIANIPGFNYLAPTCSEEYVAMLDWAVNRAEGPVAVRTPGGRMTSDPGREIADDYSTPRYEWARRGERVALIGAGAFFRRAAEAADILEAEGLKPTLINPRCVSRLDTCSLDRLKEYELVVTLEDGATAGGFGQKTAAYLGTAPVRVAVMGLPDRFENEYDARELLKRCGLEPAQIAAMCRSMLG